MLQWCRAVPQLPNILVYQCIYESSCAWTRISCLFHINKRTVSESIHTTLCQVSKASRGTQLCESDLPRKAAESCFLLLLFWSNHVKSDLSVWCRTGHKHIQMCLPHSHRCVHSSTLQPEAHEEARQRRPICVAIHDSPPVGKDSAGLTWFKLVCTQRKDIFANLQTRGETDAKLSMDSCCRCSVHHLAIQRIQDGREMEASMRPEWTACAGLRSVLFPKVFFRITDEMIYTLILAIGPLGSLHCNYYQFLIMLQFYDCQVSDVSVGLCLCRTSNV